jgi:RNA 3'-terminal phosphate cyclase (ATP)
VLVIDGSTGGGQVLRTALSSSMLTAQPFRIHDVRAMRDRPGLQRQHLAAIRAASAFCAASVDGDELGSTTVTFHPGRTVGGLLAWDIGTAGSTCLVLQTLMYPLLASGMPSTVAVRGGTHNPDAPSFEFLSASYFPIVRRAGFDASLELSLPGFYPRGGGQVILRTRPNQQLHQIGLGSSSGSVSVNITAYLGGDATDNIEFPELVSVAGSRLNSMQLIRIPDTRGRLLSLEIGIIDGMLTNSIHVATKKGQADADVVREAATQLEELLANSGLAEEHLADQLLLPAVLAGGGEFQIPRVTRHFQIQADTLSIFFPDARINVNDDLEVTIRA